MEKMETIETVVKIKRLLEPCIKLQTNESNDLDEILKKVLTYLQKNCPHELVQDMIDIDPDKSMNIVYCSICEETFS
jgi:hypothetical protein